MSFEHKCYDVIVAGGGLAGVAAAVGAAREGKFVLLLERYGFLGGMATAGFVNPFMCYCLTKPGGRDWENKVNQGIFKEMVEGLDELGGLHENLVTFNEELLKLVLDRLCLQYGVDVLFHSYLIAAQRNAHKLESVTVANKSGFASYLADYFVDATGDADLSALAGVEYKIGREQDQLCQPMTLCFRLANVDTSKFDRQKASELYKQFRQEGKIKNPREDILAFEHMTNGVVHFNSTRIIKKSAVNAQDISCAEMESREQVFELYSFMKKHIEGFEDCQLLISAPQIGVRESRRIVGEYTVTEEDLLSTKKFEDSVARGTYPIDIHNPSGTGTVIKRVPHGEYYTIPYRALIPKGIDNLIVAGRPISSTHEAHSAYRVLPIVTCIGEGAGIAAALASDEKIAFQEVKSSKIHGLMDKHQALY